MLLIICFFSNVFHLTTYDLSSLKFALQITYVTLNLIVFICFFFHIMFRVCVFSVFKTTILFFCCDLCLLVLFMFCWNIMQMFVFFNVFLFFHHSRFVIHVMCLTLIYNDVLFFICSFVFNAMFGCFTNF